MGVFACLQVWIGVVPFGPNGVALNSSYKDRDSVHYMTDLGNAIANFARLVPDGLLVFFPSYSVLTKCTEHWKNDVSNGVTLGMILILLQSPHACEVLTRFTSTGWRCQHKAHQTIATSIRDAVRRHPQHAEC